MPPPTAATLHRRCLHRWWRITAAMLVLGLLCFLLIIPPGLSSRRGRKLPLAPTTIAALSWRSLWLLCPVFLIYAIILTLKARSAAKHAAANLGV